MIIIGCDFHTHYQQIAMANDETGELLLQRRLVAVSSPTPPRTSSGHSTS